MKKTLLTITTIIAATTLVAQENRKAQIRLQDGTAIKGTIVEEKDNGDISLETRDGVVYEYESGEIKSLKFIEDGYHRARGYAGLTAGVNIPFGDYRLRRGGNADLGATINLNFGFLFHKYIGIAGCIYGSSNTLRTSYIDDVWSYGGMAAGPLFSFPATKWLDIDLRPMIAYSLVTLPGGEYWDDTYISPAFKGGAIFRFHVSRRVSLVLDADYFFTQARLDFGHRQNISTLSVNGGFAIRFK